MRIAMNRIGRGWIGLALAAAILVAGGCTQAIVADNLRSNAASFLIGVFSDSVQGALGSR